MKWVFTVGIVVATVACGTSSQLEELGDRIECGTVRDAPVDMGGNGLAGFCEDIPEAETALIFWFTSASARDEFFTEQWPSSEHCGASVVVGPEWAVAIDPTEGIVSRLARLLERIGGEALGTAEIGFPGCE